MFTKSIEIYDAIYAAIGKDYAEESRKVEALIQAHQRSGRIKRQDPRTQAYVAWSAVHGLASLLIDGQILTAVDVDGLIQQTTRTVLDGMRVPRRGA